MLRVTELFPAERSMLGDWLPLISVLLVATWVLAVGIYLTWRQGKGGRSEDTLKSSLSERERELEVVA